MEDDKLQNVGLRMQELRPKYDAVGSVYCKAIRSNVVFNRHGWKHLVYKGNRERRNKADALLRLGAFPWVKDVVKQARVASTLTRDQRVGGNILPVTYHELKHTFTKKKRDVCVVVILRQIDNGEIHYYSVRYGKKLPEK
jgi:hypothetical protein